MGEVNNTDYVFAVTSGMSMFHVDVLQARNWAGVQSKSSCFGVFPVYAH